MSSSNIRFLLLLALVSCALAHQTLYKQFEDFKVKYGKSYTDAEEETARFVVFAQNLQAIQAHNSRKGGVSYTRGVNMWTDLTQEEWESTHLGYTRIAMVNTSRGGQDTSSLGSVSLPDSIDWREQGVISPVKNQGSCGSCWAFAATEMIESYAAIATGQLSVLSAQQVTSCAPNPVNCGGTGGCEGSTPPLAYSYANLFGLVPDADYPYVSGGSMNTEACQYNLGTLPPVVSITGYDNLPVNSQEAVMEHLATVGPLAISVAASSWSSYRNGVFDGCNYQENIRLNHAVQLVGYGTDETLGDYWLVRNSWGSSWGEEGYIRLKREAEPGCGTDTTTEGHVCEGGPGSDQLTVCGMCGLLFEVSFPLGAHTM